MDKRNFERFLFQVNHLKPILAHQLKETPSNAPGLSASLMGLFRAIDELEMGIAINPKLIENLIDPSSATMGDFALVPISSKGLDESQRECAQKAVAMGNLLLVQGPPGTGKTTTICAMAEALLKQNGNVKILITSQAHSAVDNALARLSANGYGDRIVRARAKEGGEEDLITPEMALEEIARKDLEFGKVFALKDATGTSMKDYLLRSSSGGIGFSRGILGVTINSVNSAGISLKDPVDVAIIDEVGKCNFAEVLRVAQVAKKLILIGDPKQLPAVLPEFEEDKDKDLFRIREELDANPFLDFLFDTIEPNCKALLAKQYRMANPIGEVIACNFYSPDGKRVLFNGRDFHVEDALNFVRYDPRGKEVNSATIAASGGRRENQFEIEAVKELLLGPLKNLDRKDVAIIAPYRHQIALLRKALAPLGISEERIDTVDAFQGKQAKAVIFSCVRNSGRPTAYFLRPNRLNVALSRAEERVFLVGSKEYVSQVESLRDFITFDRVVNGRKCRCKQYRFEGRGKLFEN